MIDALFSINRAYLALPEGISSVVGFIAMMTDHYSIMEESGSERESDDAYEMQLKPNKWKQVKVQVGVSKGATFSFQSRDGCLSYLKLSNGSQPRAVGKRTPRVPVYRENFVPPNKKARTLDVDEVTHRAALLLTEAMQLGDPSKVSSSTYLQTEHKKSPLVLSRGKMLPKSNRAQGGKLQDACFYEESLDGSVGGTEFENGTHARYTQSLVDMEGVGTVEIHHKEKRSYAKRMQIEDTANNHSDDDGEACSSTDGLNGRALKGFDKEISEAKTSKFSPKGSRKRDKKQFCDDDFDALHALAELSTLESESSVQLKEDQNTDAKSSVPEAKSTVHHRDNVKPIGSKGKQLHLSVGVEGTTSRKSKIATYLPVDGQTVSELKQESQVSGSAMKRKRNSSLSMSQVSKTQAHGDAYPSKQLKGQTSAGEENKSPTRSRSAGEFSLQPKEKKPGESLGVSSIDDDWIRSATAVSTLTAQVPASTLDNIPAKQPNRRKMGLKKHLNSEKKASESMVNNSVNKYSVSVHGLQCLKDRLSSCLSSLMVQRWCVFEWFYSAIDYPWFAKREFVEYLNHVGLGHIPRLTRVEWGVIRSSLGKPRRFSEHFLHEERVKLHKYRETVRKTYSDLHTGVRDGVPTDLARPLSVGQRVIAIHPKNRELHDGSILTVDHDKCRVQFDRPEIGVEFVMDVDCMPQNPYENMPEAIRRQDTSLHKFSEVSRNPQVNGYSEIASSRINTLIKQEALLGEFQSSNNILLEGQCKGDASLKDFEPFRKHYATASSSLLQSRQYNGYPVNSSRAWMLPSAATSSSFINGLPNSVDLGPQEAGPGVLETVKSSRVKARSMVDAAIQAMSLVKEGEDAFVRIGDALDSLGHNNCLYTSSSTKLQTKSQQDQANGALGPHNQLLSGALEDMKTSCCGGGSHHEQNSKDPPVRNIPTELISSCVASLLMIQTCTERQYPPFDVARIIDHAFTSFHPNCPQNLPLFREIQMCMGRIKTQILALIPT